MKIDTHPVFQTCTITCGCGNTFETQSIAEKMVVEVCSACHPFFTGNERVMDTEGRIERFRKKYGNIATK